MNISFRRLSKFLFFKRFNSKLAFEVIPDPIITNEGDKLFVARRIYNTKDIPIKLTRDSISVSLPIDQIGSYAGLKESVAELQSSVAELKSSEAGLQSSVAKLKGDLAELKSSVTKLQSSEAELMEKIDCIAEFTACLMLPQISMMTIEYSKKVEKDLIRKLFFKSNGKKEEISEFSSREPYVHLFVKLHQILKSSQFDKLKPFQNKYTQPASESTANSIELHLKRLSRYPNAFSCDENETLMSIHECFYNLRDIENGMVMIQ
jgi:hypothetical protein